jgi:hypothetical protein
MFGKIDARKQMISQVAPKDGNASVRRLYRRRIKRHQLRLDRFKPKRAIRVGACASEPKERRVERYCALVARVVHHEKRIIPHTRRSAVSE